MKLLKLFVAGMLAITLAGCSNEGEVVDLEKEDTQETTEEYVFEKTHTVEIEVQNYGKIVLELDGNVAPITVENFVNLANDGFYDGLTFHRVIDGFMIQGGDPSGDGTGGSDETIKGEFSSNGVTNGLTHTRGVISMARSSDPDSASSQFFIMHEDSPHLDGEYAAFGRVIEGIEVVDEIATNTPVVDGNGTVESAEQPVIKSIKVVE